MIQDGIDYGIGYCKATEPGPEVERLSPTSGWGLREIRYNKEPLGDCLEYRQPIKLQLQAGESYYMRNGEVVGVVIDNDADEYPFRSKVKRMTWTEEGKRFDVEYYADYHETDLVEHIPQQKDQNGLGQFNTRTNQTTTGYARLYPITS